MIVVEVSWADQTGTLQRSHARMENRSVSGACIRLKPRIQVGTKLRVQWRWEEFTGVTKYCRNDGREYVVGIQRDLQKRPINNETVLTNVPSRDGMRTSEDPVSPAMIENFPKHSEDKPSETPISKLKLETVAILPVANSTAALPPRRIAHKAESEKIFRSLPPQDFHAIPRTEKQTQQPSKEKEAGKERKRMRSKWLGLVHTDDKEDSFDGNGDTRSDDKSEPMNRAPSAAPLTERPSAEPAEKSAASSPIELLSMEGIYRAAGIINPRKGYSISKVIEMLHSEHIRGSSKEMKRASVLMALDAAGISVDEVLQDARMRQEAIDAYETQQRKELEALLARKAEENIQIQAELERVKARYGERLRRNLDGMAREKATFGNWLTMKQQQSQSMAEAVELCLKTPVSEPASSALAEDSLVNASTKPV